MRLDVERGQVVKVCGLQSIEAAHTAVLAGADALGFILAESRRRVAPSHVRHIRETLALGPAELPALVGVTVNATSAELQAWYGEAQLDYIQLSGDESPDLLDDLDIPVIKTIHVTTGMSIDALALKIDSWFDHPKPVHAVLIDAKVDGAYGGSGVQSDWSVATQIAERYPAILAGGLKPGNVFEGIQSVRPRGVDVASGVEIAGVKDTALIEAFIAHARQAFESLASDQDTL